MKFAEWTNSNQAQQTVTIFAANLFRHQLNLPVVTLRKKLSSASHKVPLTENRTVGVIPTSRLSGAHSLLLPRAPKTLVTPLSMARDCKNLPQARYNARHEYVVLFAKTISRLVPLLVLWRLLTRLMVFNVLLFSAQHDITVYTWFTYSTVQYMPAPVYGLIISSLLLYSRFLTSFLCVSIPLCPQRPVWVQQSHHHFRNHVAFDFFSPSRWFTSYSAFNNFVQKSVTSQNIAIPSMFSLLNRVQYLPVFVYSPEDFLISNFIEPTVTDLFHSSPYPHFKGL